MPTLRATAAAWLAAHKPAVIVEVDVAQGSVPREAGTRMLVSADECIGTVGGGHLEWKASAKARDMLAQGGAAAAQTEHYPLGPALGQCCGGAVTLTYAALDAAALARWPPPEPLFQLQLYGAGHVGRAIVRALAPLPVHVTWIDEREEEFAAAPAPGEPCAARIERVCIDTLEAEVRHAPPGAFYLVLTHQHDLDLRITEAILRRGDFAYLGLIGSKTKRQRFVHRFEERGVAAQLIARITCPIGVPGVEGKAPEVIAAAVVAQLLQQRAARRPISRSLDRP
ncbi:MAG: xanthine dehydrogenase accessory protein XdhC [Burkholderiaceae bacterium]